jgi:predicted DNA-binding transcriptional regulator AlpA
MERSRATSRKLQDEMSYAPRGMNADRAAAYVGFSTTKFLELVQAGEMPQAVVFDEDIPRWDRYDLDAAFEAAKERRRAAPRANSFDKIAGERDGRRGSALRQ